MAANCRMSSLIWAAAVRQDQVSSVFITVGGMAFDCKIAVLLLQALAAPSTSEPRVCSGSVTVTTGYWLCLAFLVLSSSSCIDTMLMHQSALQPRAAIAALWTALDKLKGFLAIGLFMS